MKKDTPYKILTAFVFIGLFIGYINWLQAYTYHIDNCVPDHINQTCTINE